MDNDTIEQIVYDLCKCDTRDICGYCTLCSEFVSGTIAGKKDYEQENKPLMHADSCPFKRADRLVRKAISSL